MSDTKIRVTGALPAEPPARSPFRVPWGVSKEQMESRQEQAAEKTEALVSEAEKMAAATVKKAVAALRDFRDAIRPALMADTEYSAAYQLELRRKVDAEIARLEAELRALVAGDATKAYALGQESGAALPSSLGLATEDQIAQLLGVQAEKVLIATQQSADLIALSRGGLAAEIQRRIDREILLAANGAQNLYDARKAIEEILGPDGVAATRTEAIVRTETMRIMSEAEAATTQRLKDAGMPIRRVWRHSGNTWDPRTGHEEADGQEEDDEGYFHVAAERGGPTEALRYPRDPAGSAANSVNCGCWLENQVDLDRLFDGIPKEQSIR